MQLGGKYVIDVRVEAEWKAGHIQGRNPDPLQSDQIPDRCRVARQVRSHCPVLPGRRSGIA